MKLRLLLFSALVSAGVLFVLLGAQARSTRATETRPGLARATFAGGCFWCMEPPYGKIPGVVAVTSGYAGGHVKNPSYELVSMGVTGHAESVQVEYDPARVSYEQLVELYWRNIDPTERNAQFCDHGSPYRTAIFTHDAAQAKAAQDSLAALQKTKPFKEPIVTQIVPAGPFYPAEEYHQDYYKKNPIRYQYYRSSCGRDARLKQLWGDKAASH